MFNSTIKLFASMGLLAIAIHGCQQPPILQKKKHVVFEHQKIHFLGDGSPEFKMGVRHGCKTAAGFYTKDSHRFKTQKSYHEGWFQGRNKCRKLLKLDQNGDLIDPYNVDT